MLRLEVKPYQLEFKFSAKTSRGSMTSRKVWFIQITDEFGGIGIGEVAPIDRLSPEDIDSIVPELEKIQNQIRTINTPKSMDDVFSISSSLASDAFPSIRFGLEMALLDLMNGGDKVIFNVDYNNISLPINGLVWMGDEAFMQSLIKQKLEEGYRCIKLKVGAINFETEVEIIKKLRSVSDDLIIRLDANGAFQTNEVLAKLKILSQFNIHSIEQPILPMQPEAMKVVCSKSPIPIALDEELIGVSASIKRMELLQDLKPQFLVLKPTLHGGFASIKEWIDLAQMHNIQWWITSYLESNLGLNAIAQFTSLYNNDLFHGLGTGNLYHNNISSPIIIKEGYFQYDSSNEWGKIDFEQ